jgi:hypothetical protein
MFSSFYVRRMVMNTQCLISQFVSAKALICVVGYCNFQSLRALLNEILICAQEMAVCRDSMSFCPPSTNKGSV